jgi:hypothetical protein
MLAALIKNNDGVIMRSKAKSNFVKTLLLARPKLEHDEIRQIINALPAPKKHSRAVAMPDVLQRWYQVELIEHSNFGRDSEYETNLKQARKLKDLASGINELLSMPEGDQLRDIVYDESWELQGISPTKEEFDNAEAKLNAIIASLSEIEVAADQYIQKQRRSAGRPENIFPILLLRDIAELYGWYTGIEPSRQYAEKYQSEVGPFFTFASAVWRVIFGNTQGLKSAIRRWGDEKQSTENRSALIFNMKLDCQDYGEN